MLQSSARLLRLLTLLQSRRFWSGLELAGRLEVTERTLRRDVDKVRSLGYPIKSSSGVAGGYELSAGSTLPPLVLEDKEALAVALGLRMTASAGVSGLEQAAMQALLKLERLLPQRLQKHVANFNASITSLTGGPSANSETLLLLARATQETLRVSFSYSAVSGKTERSVDPCGLVHAGMRWYFVAWDLMREDFRTFRVDRIDSDVRLNGERAQKHPVPGGNIAAYVSKQVGSAPYPVQARLILFAPYEELRSAISPLVGTLTRRDEASCELLTGAPCVSSLAFHVTRLGCEFSVLEPEELVAELQQLSRRLQRSLGRAPNTKARTVKARRAVKARIVKGDS